MKVLHYIDCDSMSWIAAYIEHIKLLRDMGVEPVLLCRPGGDAERAARENGIPVKTWRPLIASVPRLSPGFGSIVREIAPDIIHTRLSSAARIAGFYGKRHGVPTVATFDTPAKAKYYRDIDS